MKKNKKVLALILCFFMISTMVPLKAYGNNADAWPAGNYDKKTEVQHRGLNFLSSSYNNLDGYAYGATWFHIRMTRWPETDVKNGTVPDPEDVRFVMAYCVQPGAPIDDNNGAYEETGLSGIGLNEQDYLWYNAAFLFGYKEELGFKEDLSGVNWHCSQFHSIDNDPGVNHVVHHRHMYEGATQIFVWSIVKNDSMRFYNWDDVKSKTDSRTDDIQKVYYETLRDKVIHYIAVPGMMTQDSDLNNYTYDLEWINGVYTKTFTLADQWGNPYEWGKWHNFEGIYGGWLSDYPFEFEFSYEDENGNIYMDSDLGIVVSWQENRLSFAVDRPLPAGGITVLASKHTGNPNGSHQPLIFWNGSSDIMMHQNVMTLETESIAPVEARFILKTEEPVDITLVKVDGETGRTIGSAAAAEAGIFTISTTDTATTANLDYNEFYQNYTVPNSFVLAEGEYKITELEAPSGYEIPKENEHLFSFSYDNAGSLTVETSENLGAEINDGSIIFTLENKKAEEEKMLSGTVKIIKQCEKSLAFLPGAGFTLTGWDEGQEISISGFTDEEGILEFKNLPMGTYLLTETVSPQGYWLMAENIVITLSPEDIVEEDTIKVQRVTNIPVTEPEEPEKPGVKNPPPQKPTPDTPEEEIVSKPEKDDKLIEEPVDRGENKQDNAEDGKKDGPEEQGQKNTAGSGESEKEVDHIILENNEMEKTVTEKEVAGNLVTVNKPNPKTGDTRIRNNGIGWICFTTITLMFLGVGKFSKR